jgi:hypothetical protein
VGFVIIVGQFPLWETPLAQIYVNGTLKTSSIEIGLTKNDY